MKFDSERTGTGTREWAEVTENIQLGCVNDCLYCYAANNANRFGRRPRAEWAREQLTKRANIKSYPERDGVVMFPSAHDITAFNVQAFIQVAKLILEKGNQLLIVTKPAPDVMMRVMDELAPWREQVLLRFTIGSIDAGLTALWEPGAPTPADRLMALRAAEHRGFAVSISIEPMLGGVEETLRVVRYTMPFSPETIWIGKMNKIRVRMANRRPEILEAIRRVEELQRDEEIFRLVDALKDNPTIRWKDSIKVVLEITWRRPGTGCRTAYSRTCCDWNSRNFLYIKRGTQMKPINFEGSNIILGANQPQYQPLPAFRVGDSAGTVISCWELEPNDKLMLEKTGRIWLSQLTFNQPLQPQLPTAYRPAELGVISGPVPAAAKEPCCTDDPQQCERCREPEDEPGRFETMNGGRVARAGEGEILVGANPFGICCPECGTVQAMGYVIGDREDGNGHNLYVDLERDEVETRRFREHLGIPGTAQDVARQLIAVDELVNQALAAVLPEEESPEDTPEKRVGQLITILGMHREVLANYSATMKHVVKGVEIARDAVREELKAQRLLSIVGQSHWLSMADDALCTIAPMKEEEKPSIILPGGRG